MKTATVFISCLHRDAEFAESRRNHLAPLEREGLIGVWYDGLIAEGSDWNDEIERQISSADVIILLVSADFIASDYAYKKELQIALDHRSRGEAIVLPIIVRPVNWEVTPLKKLKVLSPDGKPVVNWEPPDEAWRQVAIAGTGRSKLTR
jgi:internalin A